MKDTPEEERLRTLARIYGDHPDNEVAWRKLCEAAVEYAATKAGPRVVAQGGFDDFIESLKRTESDRVRRKVEDLRRAAREKKPDPKPDPTKWDHPF